MYFQAPLKTHKKTVDLDKMAITQEGVTHLHYAYVGPVDELSKHSLHAIRCTFSDGKQSRVLHLINISNKNDPRSNDRQYILEIQGANKNQLSISVGDLLSLIADADKLIDS